MYFSTLKFGGGGAMEHYREKMQHTFFSQTPVLHSCRKQMVSLFKYDCKNDVRQYIQPKTTWNLTETDCDKLTQCTSMERKIKQFSRGPRYFETFRGSTQELITKETHAKREK